jgi:hypothetical protein
LRELREHTPTAVAEGLSDLEYDGFFDDVCHSLAAVKAGSVQACDELDISTARNGCRQRLAIHHGRPAACPPDRIVPGRDPICVAWAARDPGLCHAASELDVARCVAVLTDRSACSRLREGDRDRCLAQVRRYGPSLGQERHESPAAREPTVFTLDVRGAGEPITIERNALARGARLVPHGCRYTIALADPLEPSGIFTHEPTFTLELVVGAGSEAPFELPLGPSDAVLSVTTPSLGTISSIGASSGRISIELFSPRLGGAIRGTIHGQLRRGENDLTVEGRFSTFVRDLDPIDEGCSEASGSGAAER